MGRKHVQHNTFWTRKSQLNFPLQTHLTCSAEEQPRV